MKLVLRHVPEPMSAAVGRRAPVPILLLLAVAGCRPSSPPTEPMVPPGPSFAAGMYVDVGPRWSHDGKWIAFVRSTPDRRAQLCVVDADLRRPVSLTRPRVLSPDRGYYASLESYASPDSLSWAPDDRVIAFERTAWVGTDDEWLPGTDLWATDRASGRSYPLAVHSRRHRPEFYYFHNPQWAPDGRYLAFVGESVDGRRALYVRTLTGQRPDQVRPRFDAFEDTDWPVWAPREAAGVTPRAPLLAFRQSIRRTPAVPSTETVRTISPGNPSGNRTGEVLRITARCVATFPGRLRSETPAVPRIGSLAWSGDGHTLAFTVTPDATDFQRYQIWVAGARGAGPHRVSPADGRGYFAPVWISDSALGALTPAGRRFRVVAIEVQSGATRTLGEIDSADCDWCPDRRTIVYAEPPSEGPNPPGTATTLRLLVTHL